MRGVRQKLRETAAPAAAPQGAPPAKPAEGLYDVLPPDHRLPYNVEEVIARLIQTVKAPLGAEKRTIRGV